MIKPAEAESIRKRVRAKTAITRREWKELEDYNKVRRAGRRPKPLKQRPIFSDDGAPARPAARAPSAALRRTARPPEPAAAPMPAAAPEPTTPAPELTEEQRQAEAARADAAGDLGDLPPGVTVAVVSTETGPIPDDETDGEAEEKEFRWVHELNYRELAHAYAEVCFDAQEFAFIPEQIRRQVFFGLVEPATIAVAEKHLPRSLSDAEIPPEPIALAPALYLGFNRFIRPMFKKKPPGDG